ncbi:hypothetical protein DSO57_1024498 [Entomophthora muscae]|uniref:Uncharacterized protein n=1 Tax=Entomophthora muscae TaxID=34485 RepID=A0ACC2SF62_9FUNG|nr:hypothetical protein DSO57_1024498 [Entomophthora muscae]
MEEVRVSLHENDYANGSNKANAPKRRLESLDGLRGLTIILMITANYQMEEPFPQIEHAEWDGFTIADAIFPTFVFVMGMAIPLALGSIPINTGLWLRVVKRSVLLWAIGGFLNGFPFTDRDLTSTYRYVGVLQRLGLCYFVLSVVFLLSRKYREAGGIYLRYVFPISSLLIWFLVTYFVNVPGCGRGLLTPECSVEGYIDTRVWGMSHNYEGAEYDPEGVLSTATSLVTCWLGVMVGLNMRQIRHRLCDTQSRFRKVAQLLLLGLALMFLAYALNTFIPVIKKLWTPTFVLMAGGVSLCLLGLLMYLVDVLNLLYSPVKPVQVVFRSLLKVGANPLLIYALSELIIAGLSAIPVKLRGEDANPLRVLYTYVLSSWLPKSLSSLILSQLFIWLIFVPLAWFLDNKGWYLKA